MGAQLRGTCGMDAVIRSPRHRDGDLIMKVSLRHLVVLLAGLAGLVGGPAWAAPQWQLVWQDEFEGSIGPDWVFETGNGSGGWGNNELQYYRRENATIENNALVITAKRED